MARYVHCLSAESGNIKINLACLVKVLFFYCTRDHGGLHSFPTRRSSDLQANILAATADHPDLPGKAMNIGCGRSEEHTSELQSRENLVCGDLLEKNRSGNSSGQTMV